MQNANSRQPRVGVVHDWLDTWRGGENVLAEILRIYPDASLFSLIDVLPDAFRSRLLDKHAGTSFLQHLPGARKYFRTLLPLFPYAVESLDVGQCDIVISSSHAVAKGVRTRASQFHVCYCHTPMRYAWDLREQYLAFSGIGSGLRGALAGRMLDRLREWDRGANERVTHFVANSQFVRERIARCYGREATVIHPPVDVDFFRPPDPATPRTAYVTASRWVPYKRVELIVEAFRALPERRLIVVGDGPQARVVRSAAGPNVEFVGEVSHERLRELLQAARAFVFAAEEDFGILPVEAQACGTPVIAYGKGGALETVRGLENREPTGVFFDEQSSGTIVDAVRRFEANQARTMPDACRSNAERFAASRFRAEFSEFVLTRWEEWRRVPTSRGRSGPGCVRAHGGRPQRAATAAGHQPTVPRPRRL